MTWQCIIVAMNREYTECHGVTIRKKEYMGDRRLTKVILDADAEMIEDWAFANCTALREIWLPAGIRHVSEKAFLNCDSLEKIYICCCRDGKIIPTDKCVDPVLLALMLKCRPKETDALIQAAKEEQGFLKLLDPLLPDFLSEDDSTGFVPFLAGGEEDYLTEDAAAAHCHKRQLLKTRLIYERLLAEQRGHLISPELKSSCIDWLQAHNPAAAFGLLLTKPCHSEAYFDLYFSLGLNKDVKIEMLISLTEDQPELKAKVLQKHLECGTGSGVFAGLAL